MNEIVTPSNALSLLRAPFALLFFIHDVRIRVMAVVLAMITDSLDGYLARRYNFTSRFGAVIDPLMDKFFVLTALIIFLSEEKLVLWQALAMLSRDFFLCLFGVYLRITDQWKDYRCKAIWWGKIITTLQFFVLMALTLNLSVPNILFPLFILLGFLAFIELFGVIRTSRINYKEKQRLSD